MYAHQGLFVSCHNVAMILYNIRVNGPEHTTHLLHSIREPVLVNLRHQQTHGREEAVRLGGAERAGGRARKGTEGGARQGRGEEYDGNGRSFRRSSRGKVGRIERQAMSDRGRTEYD